jgi:DNA topoisomerase-1
LAKNLVIVESPAKAKTIKNFLGKDYEVLASKGHIRDLPENSFGIKIEDGKFIPEYRITKDHSDIAKKIKDSAKKAETIYIATDEDREGEAIGYHIAYMLNRGKDIEKYPRIAFHEITKKAILNAIQNPKTLNLNNVNAQQARRLLDRIVGYKLSPLLGQKIQRGLSAGRVQSSALKLIVDREREIKKFIPIEYWTILGIFKNTEANLIEFNGEKIEKLSIKSKEESENIVNALKSLTYHIENIETKKRKTSAPAPFMTSTLQQTASSMLGFTPKKTMQIAQKLYEGVKTPVGNMGIITYMRTDSLNIAKEAQDSAIEFIKENFGDKYLEAKVFKSKSQGAQEAHEAIRPTEIKLTPADLKNYLTNDEWKLYNLIYNRFIASQMKSAEFEIQNIILASEKGKFKISGRKLTFDGFYKIYGDKDRDKLIPEFHIGEQLNLENIKMEQHFTEPPSRYSEASLIKELEKLGIGRPSTYAPTITLLQNRKYVKTEKKQLIPTEIAFKVIEVLEKHFPNIVDSNFTAKMEEELDEIAEQKKDWQKVLNEFYGPFMKQIEEGKKNIPSQKIAKPLEGEFCPECGGQLLLRKGRYGEFIACSNFPKCKYTRQLDGTEKPKPKETNIKCEKCGKPMVIKTNRAGEEFLACSGYPKCKNAKPLKAPKKIGIQCPECGGEIVEKNSKRGVFYSCENYPQCKFATNFKPVDKKCPKCGYLMGERVFRNKDIFECLNKSCKNRIEK